MEKQAGAGSQPTVWKRGEQLRKRMLARWQIYLLLLLPAAYLVIFCYVPMFGLVIAFKDFKSALGIWDSPWVGLDNFMEFFHSYKFSQVLTNTLTLSIYGLIAGFPIPIILALLLNAFPGRRYRKVVQTAAYIPYFISMVVMVGILMQLLNNRTGIYGTLYTTLTGSTGVDLFSKGKWFQHLYVWSGVWQTTGYNAIIYTAALSGIDQNLHEAAKIDGATRFQRILYVDWPGIRGTAAIMLILAAGNIMSVGYEKVLLMQTDINLSYSEVISTYVYKIGLASGIGDFSLSSAVSMFNSAINLIILVTVNTITKKISSNSIF